MTKPDPVQPTARLSDNQVRELMQIALKWAGPDENDSRSDILEIALRGVRVAAPPTAAGGDVLAVQAEPPRPGITSIDAMCGILAEHRIESDERTDCASLYRVTFDQLRAIYDRGRTAAAPAPLPDARLTNEQIDAAWDGLINGHAKSRYDIARALESARAVQPKVRMPDMAEVQKLAEQLWKGEPLPGRVLRFGAAVLGLVDAANASLGEQPTPQPPGEAALEARDAARYRWLRAGNYPLRFARSVLNDTPRGIDAAIDAAMKETP